MKRIVLISMMALAAAGAWAQDSLGQFQSGFETFAVDMAATLSYNATIGNNWSDAYIGQLPRFGVGLALGFTAVPAESLKDFFTSMGETIPTELEKVGLPIPAAALSAKIGGIVLPFDFGVKAMVLPPEATEALSAQGIAADYKLFGGNVRVGLVKEGILFPDVSFGAGYNRLMGSILVPVNMTTPSFSYSLDGGLTTAGTINIGDPKINLEWTTDSFDFTLQASKKILFLRPFAGIGYSIGQSSVGGGLAATLMHNGSPISQPDWDQIKADLTAAGYDVSSLSADGFLFSDTNSDPVLRVYGGVSLSLLFLNLDLQGIYVPKTKGLGANAMIRVQL